MNQIEHPFAWLNLDALDYNIAFVNENCGKKAVRIATKSIRSVDALRYIERNLTNCSGFMTFTAAESIYLIEQGFDHLLIGYPVMEEVAIKKLVHYIKKGSDVTFMVDHEVQVALLQKIAIELDANVNVCVDLNVSVNYPFLYFGSKRSPISDDQTLYRFLKKIKHYSNITINGIMAYDAQIAGVTDFYDFKGKALMVKTLKNRSKNIVRSKRAQAIATIKAFNPLQIVNVGGSGSMSLHQAERDVTEITVGSAFFAPALFDRYESLQLKAAAGFALRVVRQFDDETFVLQGGGYIASGASGKDRSPTFVEKDRFTFLSLEGAGEVQTPIVDKTKKLQIGDTVHLRHAKAGELCERFLTLHCVRGANNERYEGPIRTYRGDAQCFL